GHARPNPCPGPLLACSREEGRTVQGAAARREPFQHSTGAPPGCCYLGAHSALDGTALQAVQQRPVGRPGRRGGHTELHDGPQQPQQPRRVVRPRLGGPRQRPGAAAEGPGAVGGGRRRGAAGRGRRRRHAPSRARLPRQGSWRRRARRFAYAAGRGPLRPPGGARGARALADSRRLWKGGSLRGRRGEPAQPAVRRGGAGERARGAEGGGGRGRSRPGARRGRGWRQQQQSRPGTSTSRPRRDRRRRRRTGRGAR
ncbi:unnamed protein product, partial [Prorocentrum cordatum]